MSLQSPNKINKPIEIVDTGTVETQNKPTLSETISSSVSSFKDTIDDIGNKIKTPISEITNKVTAPIEQGIRRTGDIIKDIFDKNKSDNEVEIKELPAALPSNKYNVYKPTPQVDVTQYSSNTSFNILQTVEYQENQLNSLRQIEYVFQLFTIPYSDLVNKYEREESFYYMGATPREFLNKFTNKIVLIQSGITAGYSMDDINIKTFCGPNPNTRNVITTTIEFKIKEVYGCTLIDKIVNICSIYGYKQFTDMPFFISLKFRGYDEMGNIKELPEYTYIWPIMITSIKPKLQSGNNGTVYDVISVVKGNINLLTQHNTIQKSINFYASSFQDAISKLENQLNDRIRLDYPQYLELTDNNKIYEIIPEDDDNKSIIKILNNGFITQNQNINETNDTNSVRFTFDASDTIQSCLNKIFSKINFNNTDNSVTNKEEDDEDNIRQELSIQCYNQIIGYNNETDSYIKKFIFRIGLSYISFGELKSSKSDIDRLKSLIQRNLIKKQYNHFYTGKNIDVINVDIDIDNLYALVWSQNLVGKNSPLRSDIKIEEDKPKLVESGNDTLTPTMLEHSESVDNSNNVSYKRNYTFKDMIETRGKLNRPDEIRQSKVSFNPIVEEEVVNTETEGLEENENNILDGVEYGVSQTGTIYLEDIPFKMPDVEKNPIFTPCKFNSIINPEILKTDAGEASFKDEKNLNRATLLNQWYDTAAMIKLDIQIKGDPYWLGTHDVFSASSNIVDYTIGTPLYYFETKTTGEVDEGSGLQRINNGVSFRGLYSVIKVEHKFSDGLFTQTLYSIRNTTIKV